MAQQAITVDSAGQVGIGTTQPQGMLHVESGDNANTIIRIQNTDASGASAAAVIQSKADVAQVSFQSHGSGRTLSRFGKTLGGWNEMLGVLGHGFIIGTFTDKPLIFGTNSQNRLEIQANGDVVHFSAGQVHPDYVFEPGYSLESIEEHAEAMWRDRHLPSVGAGEYTEDGRAIFKLGAGRAGVLEELEKAHIYIEQLNEELQAKGGRIENLEQRLAQLEKHLFAGREASLDESR